MGGQQPAAGVDGELAFATLNLFVAVEALVRHAALAEFDRLRVYDSHAGVGLARGSGLSAVQLHQHFIELRPPPVGLPAAEIVKANGIRRQVVGQQAPLATALD